MRKSRARTGNVARHSHGIWIAIERFRVSAGNYANYTNCPLPIAPNASITLILGDATIPLASSSPH